MNRIQYKKTLTIDEQIEYLKNIKHVVFIEISEEKAKNILYENNYINVITPYKHLFAKTDIEGITIRDAQGKHIYEQDTDFTEYNNAYHAERDNYSEMFSNISKFESTLNSILSNETILYYSINSREKFDYFMKQLLKNINSFPVKNQNSKQFRGYSGKTLQHMRNEISSMHSHMEKYEDIYIFMDRLSLSELITVFRCLDLQLRSRIFKELAIRNLTFGYQNFSSFDIFLTRIAPIRNCICHHNSLEILINYYDIKNHSMRTEKDRKIMNNVINRLK